MHLSKKGDKSSSLFLLGVLYFCVWPSFVIPSQAQTVEILRQRFGTRSSLKKRRIVDPARSFLREEIGAKVKLKSQHFELGWVCELVNFI